MGTEDTRSLEWVKLLYEMGLSAEYKAWACPNCGTIIKITYAEYGSPDNRMVGCILHCPTLQRDLFSRWEN
jgi:predicted RNA-binding Zn-ribbon protein involved in translation (DUF1610 family)